jgi:hypothetical protein
MSLEIVPLDAQRSSKINTLPQPPFSSYVVAQKGGGKTTMILNLLTRPDMLKDTFNKIYWISPTAKLDAKLDILRYTEILTPNKLLIKLLKKLKKQKKNTHPFGDENDISEDDIEKCLTDENFIDEPDPQFLTELITGNKQLIEQFGKKFSDKILVIFDDCISSKIFKSTAFNKFLLNSRHYNISTFIISQTYYLLPKTIRNNSSLIILFETGNTKELQQIYEENNCGLSWNDFYQMYKQVMEKPYNFICFNYQNMRKYRLQEGFQHFIQMEK